MLRGQTKPCRRAVIEDIDGVAIKTDDLGKDVDRLGDPTEIARVVRFLIDEASGFITGATFDVNGGMYM